MSLPQLHDASLKSIEIKWSEGTATFSVVYFPGDGAREGDIRLIGLSKLEITRAFPWGPSHSILEVTLHQHQDSVDLSIQMQSGDEIRAEADSFYFEDLAP